MKTGVSERTARHSLFELWVSGRMIQPKRRKGDTKCHANNVIPATLLLIVCCLLCGCTASRNVLKDSPAPDGAVAGFWLGLWHGIILPISFVVSLFQDTVNVYEVHNNGGEFWFLARRLHVRAGREVPPESKQKKSKNEKEPTMKIVRPWSLASQIGVERRRWLPLGSLRATEGGKGRRNV